MPRMTLDQVFDDDARSSKPMLTATQRFENPTDEFNGPSYHTGKPCIEPECNNPAGTWWSRLWCFECNVKRMRRIDAAFNSA